MARIISEGHFLYIPSKKWKPGTIFYERTSGKYGIIVENNNNIIAFCISDGSYWTSHHSSWECLDKNEIMQIQQV